MVAIRIINLAGFVSLFNLLNGTEDGGTAIERLLAGNIDGAWRKFSNSAQYILMDNDGRAKLTKLFVTLGLAEFVADTFKFKKSFTVGNLTIGI